MKKISYPLANPELNILTPQNETYNNKDIPVIVTTTAGEFVQSGGSIKISNSKAQPKSKNHKFDK